MCGLWRGALQLAAHGAGFVSPNPMVGAVIVAPGGRIIGEGWHRRWRPACRGQCGGLGFGSRQGLLRESSIYVSLEPLRSHYGKTPPRAALFFARCGFRRVVVACGDPNPKVAGRGIAMLREAGCEVETGVLEEEARRLNRRFTTAQTKGRPWIQLKWAESLDGFIGGLDAGGNPQPVRLSSATGSVWMHRSGPRPTPSWLAPGLPSRTVRLLPSAFGRGAYAAQGGGRPPGTC